jgi:hypothetical protein
VLDDPSAYMMTPDPVVVPADLADSEKTDVRLYEPTVFSLTRARTFCQQQMVRIVTEVDAVGKNPDLASIEGKMPYQSPDIFRARLPVLKKVEPASCGSAGGSSLKPRKRTAFAALRLDSGHIHLYYLDSEGNLRATGGVTENGKPTGAWMDLGIVEEAKNVAANTPIAATTLFATG